MKRRAALCAGALLISIGTLFSQQPPTKNPKIEKIVSEISSSNIKAIVEKLVSFKTRNSLSDTMSSEYGIGAARRWIKSEFERYAKASPAADGGRMSVEFQEFIAPTAQRILHPTRIINVIATLSPSILNPHSSNRIFIISGHYDSRASNVLDSTSVAPGANDDASGTALVMELARVFSTREVNATIKFVAFAGEEQGLIGSTQLAEKAKKEGWNIQGVFNNDIVGSISGNGEIESTYVRLFSEAYSPLDTGSIFRQRNSLGLENDGASRSLARYIKEASERYISNFSVKLIYRRDRFLRGGDHLPFHERGFAAIRFTEADENFDHQHQDVRTEGGKSYGDLPEFMNFNYCANVARINAAAVASLALAPAPPRNVQIVTKNLEYSTQLRWNKNPEPAIAGYYVRYRETVSPFWQHQIFTKDTTITLNVSKDDYLFGVQAVDNDGNPSNITIPNPVR
jgi:Zn-dependent M28 family amino/carboxypeptidase